jgi:glycosyltransferase involved in cell wall biosynthesis
MKPGGASLAAVVIPVSVVIPTRNRAAVLRQMLESLAAQSSQPEQIILVDASEDQTTRRVCVEQPVPGLMAEVVWRLAQMRGAARQRNQGMRECRHAVIGFFDDDILFEPECVVRLWGALQSDAGLGGVNAMIANQSYSRPGRLLRAVLAAIAEPEKGSYAGRIIGPAIQFLPQDGTFMPTTVPVQWLNTTCTLYRRDLLPDPPFDTFFTGYSLREDVALSLRVARRARLVNVPAARIYHDSQRGEHKADLVALNRMDTVNRHYVMTEVMRRRAWSDHAGLVLWECCQLGICAIQQRLGWTFWQTARGKLLGLFDIALGRAGRHAR